MTQTAMDVIPPTTSQPIVSAPRLGESSTNQKHGKKGFVPSHETLSASKVEDADEEDIGSDDDDERSDDDDDDAGSLVDFIVDDEEEGEEGNDDDSQEEENEEKEEKEGEGKGKGEPLDDMDGISTTNIITGKRTRRQTQFYEETVFNTKEYRNMMLCDVPKEELHALEDSGDEEEEEEDEEDEYEDDEQENDEDEDSGEDPSDDDGEEEEIPMRTKKTKTRDE